MIDRLRIPCIFTGFQNLCDTASPGFNETGAVKGVGNQWIIWSGTVFAEKIFHRPVLRENAVIGDNHFIRKNLNLNRNERSIIFMRNRIQYSFANGLSRVGVGFNSRYTLIRDNAFQIFCIKQIYRFFRLI